MNFLKADKEKPCQIVASFFKRKKRPSVDPTLLQLIKKVNQKVSHYIYTFKLLDLYINLRSKRND